MDVASTGFGSGYALIQEAATPFDSAVASTTYGSADYYVCCLSAAPSCGAAVLLCM